MPVLVRQRGMGPLRQVGGAHGRITMHARLHRAQRVRRMRTMRMAVKMSPISGVF